MRNRIIVAGGSGFIGRLLTDRLVSGNNDVVVLTRSPGPAVQSIRQVGWDGRTLGDWARELEGARALINLAGRSVNCRYNERNRREILESRVDSTRVLGEAIARCSKPPPVWLNVRPPAKLVRLRRPRMHSRSRSPVLGKKRSSTRLRLRHGRSHCAPLWSSPRAKVVSTGSCEGSRDGGWEAPLPAGINIFPGFTKLIFAALSNG